MQTRKTISNTKVTQISFSIGKQKEENDIFTLDKCGKTPEIASAWGCARVRIMKFRK